MTDQADQTIIIRYILDAQDAIEKAKSLQAETDKIRTEMQLMASKSNVSFKELASAMKTQNLEQYKAAIAGIKAELQANLATVKGNAAGITQYNQQAQTAMAATKAAYTQTNQAISAATTQLQQANKQFVQGAQQTQQAVNQTKTSFGALAVGIGAALGISAVGIVRNFFQSFINYCQQAIESGYEFAKGLYQINVGVNALRRAGTDITFGDVLQQLQKLKTEFGIFSTKDLVVGASAFLNLNRDMGFTKEQLFDLQEAVATLAVVNGRAMDEVQKTVALALSSGYTEGLQRLGVSINRVTIAEEAARLGYAKSYMALTEVQRAEATYNLILEKTAVYSDDLLQYQRTLPGAIDKTTAAITDATAKTGESLLGLKYLWEQLKLAVVNYLNSVLDVRNQAKEGFKLSAFPQLTNILQQLDLLSGAMRNWSDLKASISDTFNNQINPNMSFLDRLKKAAEDIRNILSGANINVTPEVTPKVAPALTDEQIASVESTANQIIDLQEQYNIDRRDLEIDLQRDLEQIDAEGNDKLVELAAEHAQKMLDITNKASDQIADAESKYGLSVQQAWDEYYSNVAGAAEKHSNKLLKIEEDYQEKLKRIKEGFMVDLEDALEARDARQVLRLIRQYNIDKAQATRERDQNLKEEERSYREQLRELDRQRDDRLKKLRQEFEQRTAEIIRQRDRELALEVEAYTKKNIEQQHENEVDRGERLQRYQEDLDDLALHLQDRLKSITEGLMNEAKITSSGMQAVLDVVNTYIGPGGITRSVYDSFVLYAQAAMAAAMSALMPQWVGGTLGNYDVTLPPLPQQSKGGVMITKPPKSYAQGGMEVANKPTLAVFGDAGPELHLFLPLNGNLSNLSSTGKGELPNMKMGGSSKDKLQVEILLGEGLEGRIVDKTMNNVADVVFKSIKR